LPWALLWYFGRLVRQKLLLLFFSTLGRYGFRQIGKGIILDGWVQFVWPCADIRIGNQVRIGRRCVFQGFPDAIIDIGNQVAINDGAYITSMFGITIGERTSIGEYVSIRDYDHRWDNPKAAIQDQGYTGAPIWIGRDCWIGRGVFIKGGVTIGEGAVIGANAVVTKDIPAWSVAVGNPARVIKHRIVENN
jgi:acetyltransferase-like isoleucine patch superfamily enzyme